MSDLESTINDAWEKRTELSPGKAPAKVGEAVSHVIEQLNQGTLRVAEKKEGAWVVHQWIKKAVLLSFRLKDNEQMQAGSLGFYDKVPTKFSHLSAHELKDAGVRIVPPAVARRAKSSAFSPSGVSATKRWPRSPKVAPSSSSSLRICPDSVGCDTWHASAARPKWPRSATARTYCRSRRFMGKLRGGRGIDRFER